MIVHFERPGFFFQVIDPQLSADHISWMVQIGHEIVAFWFHANDQMVANHMRTQQIVTLRQIVDAAI